MASNGPQVTPFPAFGDWAPVFPAPVGDAVAKAADTIPKVFTDGLTKLAGSFPFNGSPFGVQQGPLDLGSSNPLPPSDTGADPLPPNPLPPNPLPPNPLQPIVPPNIPGFPLRFPLIPAPPKTDDVIAQPEQPEPARAPAVNEAHDHAREQAFVPVPEPAPAPAPAPAPEQPPPASGF